MPETKNKGVLEITDDFFENAPETQTLTTVQTGLNTHTQHPDHHMYQALAPVQKLTNGKSFYTQYFSVLMSADCGLFGYSVGDIECVKL